MAKTEARPEEIPRERGGGRVDSVKPPPDLPETSPLDRMTELTRRIVGVPKDEALTPAKRKRRH
jgi:hypothetical protein